MDDAAALPRARRASVFGDALDGVRKRTAKALVAGFFAVLGGLAGGQVDGGDVPTPPTLTCPAIYQQRTEIITAANLSPEQKVTFLAPTEQASRACAADLVSDLGVALPAPSVRATQPSNQPPQGKTP